MTDATAIPVNIFETEDALVIEAPMPGVTLEDVSIDLADDGRLTLRARTGHAATEPGTSLRSEWSHGPYERTLMLPVPVDARRATLSHVDGVLSITLPKAGSGPQRPGDTVLV